MGRGNNDHLDVLRKHGRTFWLASFFLDQSTADAAARLYKFCRILDDMADCGSRDAEIRLLSLRKFFCSDRPNDLDIPPEDKALVELIEPLKFDGRVISSMIDGFLWDLNHEPFANSTQLLRYCYHVAGVVGVLMSDVLGCEEKTAGRYHAIDLGIAMQLTNISRDVLEDAEMDRRYIPTSLGINELKQGVPSAEMKKALASAVEHSEHYYTSGIKGICYLPRRVRPCVYVMTVLYRAISRKLLRGGLHWRKGRTVLSRFEIAALIIASLPACLWLVIRPPADETENWHRSQLHEALEGLPEVNV